MMCVLGLFSRRPEHSSQVKKPNLAAYHGGGTT
jgi:hypothetical protein